MAIGNKRRASANLVHANARAKAQLIQAHKSATAGSAAPLIAAPTPRGGAYRNPSLPPPVEVGGEKAHHGGFATQAAKGASVGGIDLTLHQMGDGAFELRDANGNVRRTYSAGQMANITRRGNSGATMDDLDTAAFFRIGGGKTEREIAAEDEERKAEIAARAKRGEMDYAHKQALEKQLIADKLATERAEKTAKITAQGRVDAEKIKAEADAKKAELARQQEWIAKGRTSDMTDDDYARWIQMGGDKGRAEWDYTQKDKDWIDARRAEVQDKIRSGEITQSDADSMFSQIDEQAKSFKKEVRQKDNMPDSDGPIVSPNGKWYWDTTKQGVNGRTGAWSPMPNEPKVQEPPEQKREADRLKAEQARADKLQDEKNKYILGQIGDARKAWKKSVDDYNSSDDPSAVNPGEFDEAAAKKIAEANWNAVYGSPTPTPNPQESTPAPDPNDPLAEFSQFKR